MRSRCHPEAWDRGIRAGRRHGPSQGRDDSFKLTDRSQGIQGLLVGHSSVFGTPDLAEIAVFRPHTGVIKSGTDGMGLLDLPIAILKRQAHGAVQNTDAPLRDGGGAAAGVDAPAASTPISRTEVS